MNERSSHTWITSKPTSNQHYVGIFSSSSSSCALCTRTEGNPSSHPTNSSLLCLMSNKNAGAAWFVAQQMSSKTRHLGQYMHELDARGCFPHWVLLLCWCCISPYVNMQLIDNGSYALLQTRMSRTIPAVQQVVLSKSTKNYSVMSYPSTL